MFGNLCSAVCNARSDYLSDYFAVSYGYGENDAILENE